MNLYLLIPIILYFCTLIGFNLYIRRQNSFKHNSSSTESVIQNYSLSNRKISAFALAMSSASTYASASSFISGPGAAFNYGIGWVVIALIQVPTMWFAFTAIGTRINNYANQHQCFTINDILVTRYKSRTLVLLTSIILLLCFITSICVQFIGAARLLEGTLNIQYSHSLIAFTLVIAIYTVLGTFKTVAYTDIIQGIIMFLGSLLLLGLVIHHLGGVSELVTNLTQTQPELVSAYNQKITPELYLSFWILVCFGVVGMPQTALRTMANSDPHERNQAILIATIVLFVIMLAMHLSGFLANGILNHSELNSPDLVIPKLILAIMPPLLAALFILAPVASIISTIDGLLIQSTSTVVNDIFLASKSGQRFKAEDKNKLKLILAIRFTTFAILICSFLVSLYPPKILVWMNILSFGVLQATFLWPLVLGLFFPSVTKQSAISSILVGVATYSFFSFSGVGFFGYHQILPSLLFSLLTFGAVHLLTKNNNNITA